MAIIVNLDVAMAKKKMSLTELSDKVGISMTNLFLLKTEKLKELGLAPLKQFAKYGTASREAY
jgi:putative transcriptional regulator